MGVQVDLQQTIQLVINSLTIYQCIVELYDLLYFIQLWPMYFSSSISAFGLSEHSEKTLRLMTDNIIVYPSQFQVGDPTDRENHQYIYMYIIII